MSSKAKSSQDHTTVWVPFDYDTFIQLRRWEDAPQLDKQRAACAEARQQLADATREYEQADAAKKVLKVSTLSHITSWAEGDADGAPEHIRQAQERLKEAGDGARQAERAMRAAQTRLQEAAMEVRQRAMGDLREALGPLVLARLDQIRAVLALDRLLGPLGNFRDLSAGLVREERFLRGLLDRLGVPTEGDVCQN